MSYESDIIQTIITLNTWYMFINVHFRFTTSMKAPIHFTTNITVTQSSQILLITSTWLSEYLVSTCIHKQLHILFPLQKNTRRPCNTQRIFTFINNFTSCSLYKQQHTQVLYIRFDTFSLILDDRYFSLCSLCISYILQDKFPTVCCYIWSIFLTIELYLSINHSNWIFYQDYTLIQYMHKVKDFLVVISLPIVCAFYFPPKSRCLLKSQIVFTCYFPPIVCACYFPPNSICMLFPSNSNCLLFSSNSIYLLFPSQ